MGKKKSISRPGVELTFRESDFAGMAPQTQAELSGSLNQLSEQIAATRKLLQDIGPVPVVPLPARLGGSEEAEVPDPGAPKADEATPSPPAAAPPDAPAPKR